MYDLQAQVNTMIEALEEKVHQMWDETSKFVNSLEDKVQTAQKNQKVVQEELLIEQNLRLNALEQYNSDLEKYNIT